MNSIILTGPKHSGKTYAGRVLASLCSCDFIDLDELILQRTGKSPRRLYGESQDIFKKAEAEAMANLFKTVNDQRKYRVIAAGGGIIENHEASGIIKKSGATVILLDISVNNAWERIVNCADGELPPYLRTENPQETHRVIHEKRTAAYLQLANIVINVDGKSPEEIAGECRLLLVSVPVR